MERSSDHVWRRSVWLMVLNECWMRPREVHFRVFGKSLGEEAGVAAEDDLVDVVWAAACVEDEVGVGFVVEVAASLSVATSANR